MPLDQWPLLDDDVRILASWLNTTDATAPLVCSPFHIRERLEYD